MSNASKESVERILAKDVLNGDDRKTLRQWLLNAESGRGNSPFHPAVQDTVKKIREVLSIPLVDARSSEQKKRWELSEYREKGTLSPYDFDLNYLFELSKERLPLAKSDLRHETGLQAVVLTRDDMEILGGLEFIHSSGEAMFIEPESVRQGDILVLYPWELSNPPKEIENPSLKGTTREDPTSIDEIKLAAATRLTVIFEDVLNVRITESLPWIDILHAHGEYPAQAILEGRKADIPEKYIRSFAFNQCLRHAEKGDLHFIARFLKNLKFGSEEQVKFFEDLATK